MKILHLPREDYPPRTEENCDWILHVKDREYLLFEDEYQAFKYALKNKEPHFWSADGTFGFNPIFVSDEVQIKHNLLPEPDNDAFPVDPTPDRIYTPEEIERHKKNADEIKRKAAALAKKRSMDAAIKKT
jgi:hypothetical protein